MRLKGIASATKKLADGSRRKYYYAWRGGPQLPGEPGQPEFMAAYQAAIAGRVTPATGQLGDLIATFKARRNFAASHHALRRTT